MKTPARVLILTALAAAAARGDDWPHLGRDGARSRAPVESVTGPAALGVRATGAETAASPAAADGIIVVAALDGVVRAFREHDLSPLWSSPLPAPVLATPAIDRGRVHVACADGVLYVLRLADGSTVSTITTGGADQGSPVPLGGRLYLASGFPNVSAAAVDLVAGAVAWESPMEQLTAASPAVAGSTVYLPASSGRLYAFDAATGAETGSVALGGTVGSASPLVDGTSVFLLSEARLWRTGLDLSAPASASIADPAPPTGALGVERMGSSVVFAGGRIVGAVRFVYAMNLDGDPYGYVDTRVLREVAFAVDPATLSVQWRTVLGQATVPTQNGIPPHRIVASPVATGAGAVFASGVTAELRILDSATGSSAGSFPLDAPSLASPIVANARIVAVSRVGTLYSFQSVNAPPAVGGLSPAEMDVDATPAALGWTSSETGTFLVRIDDDGEILMDWDWETEVAATSVAPPALGDGAWYTWGVRPRDADSARGGWATAVFGQNVPPLPPTGLVATPKHGRALLAWTRSASSDVAGYRLWVGPGGGPLGPPVDLGDVAAAVVDLPNGATYRFEVRAVDATGDVSAAASATATVASLITVGGIPYDTIAAALAAAGPGGTVLLGADTFPVATTIDVPAGVRLMGVDGFATRLAATAPVTMVRLGANASVALLSLSGGSTGVEAAGTEGGISNVVIAGMTGDGVTAPGSAAIVNATIVRNGGAGVRATGSATVRNSILQENVAGIVGNVAVSFSAVDAGISFLDASTGDYREQAGEASLDAGAPGDEFAREPAPNGGRVNQGAFGNTSLAAASPPGAGGPPPAASVVAAASSSSNGRCSATIPVGPSGAWMIGLAMVAALLRSRR